jgi:hypothetical protein
LIIIVFSHVANFGRRQLVRETWGNTTNFPNVQLGFVLGTSGESHEGGQNSTTSLTDLGAQGEAISEKDLIILPYNDTWRNLTYKNLGMLHFLQRNCLQVPYHMRIDDDITVRLPNVLKFINSIPKEREGIFGAVFVKNPVLRTSKYAVPLKVYPSPFYPVHLSGQAYIMSSAVVPRLHTGMLNARYIQVEDALATGIVAKEVGVKRFGVPGWLNKLNDNTTKTQNWTINAYE